MIRRKKELILKALETGYFFRGEYIHVFWGKGMQERFEYKPQYRSAKHEFNKLSKVNQWRFIVSCYQWSNKGEPKIYDYDPSEIIPLTKDMKIALLKYIATGIMTKEEQKLFIYGIGWGYFYMLSSREIEEQT